MKRGLTRFWYRFKNWFRTKPGPGVPLRFLCGSEEELRQVTTWICHVHAHIFQGGKTVRVGYKTKDDYGDGGGHLGLPPNVEPNLQRELSPWFALLLKHNEFTGSTWLARAYDAPRLRPEAPGYRSGMPNWFGIVEYGRWLFIEVYRPSAHERAEALLALSEWLDGKVSEQEKRELLQLPDDMEV